ncbi:coenzyme F420-0:L-glutamate ligase [Ferruginivarius sediminum]|uniref:Coenzyme F420-0:L-glutamate ligase n=1 Tax=Ferruginivarius sediminum TaxID=2661937 RepID=A0A369T691_9PROT|nr:coenzyme F420-0:L-glutamate ligase [Ferruginivarius sediminum]RDD60412.1 coenzyme F420-0:L-glutamate ligase [Ferruginivarius sediminum]
MRAREVTLTGVADVPPIAAGDDLASIIAGCLDRQGVGLIDGDVLVVAQKIVSKAEGRFVDLAAVTPSAEARTLAAEVNKDPRVVELILRESVEVVAKRPGVVIVAHRLGYVMANAGIDRSNVTSNPEHERVLLLPENPDNSCAFLRAQLVEKFGARIGVVMSDSFGRPWRLGVTGVALGAAGLPALRDCIGECDLYGRELEVTQIAVGDEIASAAALVMGEADEGVPVVVVRGLSWPRDDAGGGAATLVRPPEEDLFRRGSL